MSDQDPAAPRPEDVALSDSDVVDEDLGARPQRISLNDREARLVLDALETPRADVVERLRELRNRA